MPGLPVLNPVEARIIGCLMEKSVTTPNQYPLTLNALTNACNQKSARSPAMTLNPGEVQHAVRDLAERHLVRIEENFRSGVEKYTQRFCNSRYGSLQLDPPEYAIVCLLLLRGPQTPGELRSNSGRLHSFADKQSVRVALQRLEANESGPLVVELPRTPGRKDVEFMHLLAGPVDVAALAAEAKTAAEARSAGRPDLADLEARVAQLEAEVAALKTALEG